MDDNQTPEQAPDEVLVSEANTSEAEAEENTEAEAEKGDEGTADAEADSSEDDESEDDDQPKRKKKSGLDRLKRRLEALEAENQTLRSRQPVADSGNLEAAVRAEIGDPPQEKDYPDYLSYERAMIAFEADKRLVTREIKKQFASQASQQQARQAEVFEAYTDRLEEAEKAVPGLKAAIAKADVQISGTLTQLIVESDKGPLLAHHLAKNPQKAAELNRMSPVAAAREIGRLEARLSFPRTQTATKAPPPVTPLKGAASPSDPQRELQAWLAKTYGRR